ncbi:hypothetical protein [Arthrobacter sp. A2-55]|uniref:hypothetical protein n=1 Tax=Arthrobacter sp. A2-55 TaxID=2897337 RepID=UPI0021CD6895|nr:hypothetical protein [Arthrobacter sp. A2-55]MCU6482235.1 hypothetical protein [Arthrobacter sp. A2-55]
MVFSTWWSWLLVIAVLAAVTLILFAGRRGAGDSDAIAGAGMVRATRTIAWIYVAACSLSGLGNAAATVWGEAVTVKLPVAQFWPSLPAHTGNPAPRATVESGGFSWADVSVSGLDLETRLMLTGAIVAQGVLAVVAGLVIIRLCAAITDKTLFGPRLVKGSQQLAGVVLLGGMIWQGCQLFGGTMAAQQVLGGTGWSTQGSAEDGAAIHHITGLPSVSYAWEFNFWPIGVALALMVLAELFRQGGKVQKDVAGLI